MRRRLPTTVKLPATPATPQVPLAETPLTEVTTSPRWREPTRHEDVAPAATVEPPMTTAVTRTIPPRCILLNTLVSLAEMVRQPRGPHGRDGPCGADLISLIGPFPLVLSATEAVGSPGC